MLAQVCGYRPGDFVHTFGDAPLQHNHFDRARKQLTRTPRALPTMHLNLGARDLFGFRFEDFALTGYDPYPHIAAAVWSERMRSELLSAGGGTISLIAVVARNRAIAEISNCSGTCRKTCDIFARRPWQDGDHGKKDHGSRYRPFARCRIATTSSSVEIRPPPQWGNGSDIDRGGNSPRRRCRRDLRDRWRGTLPAGLPLARRLYLTEVAEDATGPIFSPKFDRPSGGSRASYWQSAISCRR